MPIPSILPERSTSLDVLVSSPIDLAAFSRSPPIALAFSSSSSACFFTALLERFVTMRSRIWLCTSSKLDGCAGMMSLTIASATLVGELTAWETSPFLSGVTAWSKSGIGPNSGTTVPGRKLSTRKTCMLYSAATFSGCAGSFCRAAGALSDASCIKSLTRCFFHCAGAGQEHLHGAILGHQTAGQLDAVFHAELVGGEGQRRQQAHDGDGGGGDGSHTALSAGGSVSGEGC